MKNVDIEFMNIQSHEHTRFHLQPGLNFILAEDNNVGKSTVFKVLLCAMHLPQVPTAELNELVRGGCTQARATFRFDDVTCTLWMFREGDHTVRAFFETRHGDEPSVRSLGAPGELRDAFDIVTGLDGKVVNFNDADSVQLIVQDTPKNDEILAKVLIDLRVDNVKANAYKLNQQLQQDYRLAQSKLDDVNHILSTARYVSTVDDFNDEHATLSAACRVADAVVEPWTQLEAVKPLPDGKDFQCMHAALRALEDLQGVDVADPPIVRAISPDLFVHMGSCLKVLQKLEEAAGYDIGAVCTIKKKHLENANRGLQVLSALEQAAGLLSFSLNASRDAERYMSERARLLHKISEVTKRVTCPVKGEVYYSDEECIPCGDRPAL